jgi:hypothetical protein
MARWLTFIGGHYSRAGFIDEAREMGAQRVISRSNARQTMPGGAQGIEFGDTVLCGWWPDRTIFAEFTVDSLTLNGAEHLDVVDLMLQTGVAVEIESAGAGLCVRDCGSYISLGVVRVDCSLQAVLDLLDTTGEKGYKLLVGGPLTLVHETPLTFEEAGVDREHEQTFRRGFIALDSYVHNKADDQQVRVITGYRQRRKKARQDTQARMPPPQTETEEA